VIPPFLYYWGSETLNWRLKQENEASLVSFFCGLKAFRETPPLASVTSSGRYIVSHLRFETRPPFSSAFCRDKIFFQRSLSLPFCWLLSSLFHQVASRLGNSTPILFSLPAVSEAFLIVPLLFLAASLDRDIRKRPSKIGNSNTISSFPTAVATAYSLPLLHLATKQPATRACVEDWK
jgi:hypothetical protein